MKLIVDKVTLSILLGIVVVTVIMVIILRSIHPMITAEVGIKCEQINFSMIKPENSHRWFSLLNTGPWITQAKISRFNAIKFKVLPSTAATDLARYCDGAEVVVSPISANSNVTLNSAEEAFSLRDIFLESNARISWSAHNNGQWILIKNETHTESSEISAAFSTGDSLRLGLFNCVFLDQKGEVLYETRPNVVEEFTFPISFGKPQVSVITDSGQLEIAVETQDEFFAENNELLRDLEVDHVDYYKKEYSRTGQVIEQNTVLEGTVKRPSYSLDDSVRVRMGDVIKTMPARGYLKSLRVGSGYLEASIRYHAQSIRIGPDRIAEHELVKSKLDTLWGSQTLIIIYTITLSVFGIITRLIIQRKKGGD